MKSLRNRNRVPSLDECMAAINRIVDTESLTLTPPDDVLIKKYYLHSARPYRILHSYRGAIHMALSRGSKMNRAGLVEQVKSVLLDIDETESKNIIEFGCGNAFNLIALYERRPELNLVGVDLCRTNLKRAKRMSGRAPIQLIEADFHQVPIADSAMDLVIGIESLCYSSDPELALAEIYRVLRPGGRAIVFDAHRCTDFESLEQPMKYAAQLVERSMALPDSATHTEWIDASVRQGFSILIDEDVTRQISANLLRFQSLAQRVMLHPWLARVFVRTSKGHLLRNAIAGLLMPITTSQGAHAYFHVVLEKPKVKELLKSSPIDSSSSSGIEESVPGTQTQELSAEKSVRNTQSASRYRSYHADYRTWLDDVLEVRPGHSARNIVMITFANFLVGLVVSLCAGFPERYVSTPSLYLFCGGVPIALFVMYHASRRIHTAVEEMRPIFTVSDSAFKSELEVRFARIASTRGCLTTSALVFFFYASAVTLAMFAFTFISRYGLIALRPDLVGPFWYTSHEIAFKYAIFLWLGVLPSLIIGSGLWMITNILVFLLDLRNWEVIPLTSVARMRLRSIVNLLMFSSFGWFVSEGIVSVLFTGHFDNLFWVCIGLLLPVGVLLALLPQLLFRRMLLRSYSDVCTWALHELASAEGLRLKEGGRSDEWMSAFRFDAPATHLHHLIEATAKPNLWVYDSEDLLVLGLGQAAAIGAIILELALRH